MKKGIGYFLGRLLDSKSKDLFYIRLGVSLTLSRFGIQGPLEKFLSFILCGFLGLLHDEGIFLIDIGLDAYREGQKLEEFKVKAREIYERTKKRVYDEQEKERIRKEYLDIIKRIGVVGKS